MRTLTIIVLFALTAAAQAADAPKLSRLFFTPEQRLALDAERQQAKINALKPQPPVSTMAQAPKEAPKPKAMTPQIVTLNGIVRRSDGQSTVWVNNKVIQNGSAAGPVSAGSISNDSVDIKLNSAARGVQLKVGQTVSSATGKVEEQFNRRRTPKYVAPPERDSSPAAPEGKSSDTADNATDNTGAGTTESSNSTAR
jgi:hypothetical protein